MAKLRSYKALTSAEEKIFESIFQPVTRAEVMSRWRPDAVLR